MAHMHTKYSNTSLLAGGERVSEEHLAEEMKVLAFERRQKLVNRRTVLTGLAGAGTLAMTGALSGCNDSQTVVAPSSGPGVFDVLNFALNLEYLEANFYLYVTTGAGLSATDMGISPGAITNAGSKYTFVNPTVGQAAQQLALDEKEHVEFLRSTISSSGGTPVSQPALNLGAMGAVTSDATFLSLARQLEAVGVSAYIGGAQYLVSNTAALQYAAQILDTEAQHAGFLRELCINLGVSSPAVDSQDTPPTSTAIFNTSATTGLNPVRTTSQVLQIVYAAAGQTGVSKGGFFPNGLNGTIVTS